MATAQWITGDTRQVMADLPPASVDLVLTSPPFLALRSYLPADHEHKALEIGSEATPGQFIDTLVDVVEACARLLTPHGTLAFELGDTYAGSGGAGGDYNPDGFRDGQPKFRQVGTREHRPEREGTGADGGTRVVPVSGGNGWPLDKSLSLIPELFRITLAYGTNPLTGRQTDPWRIRNVIRWVRNNPPVGSLADKFRPATSELVIACKAKDRWFDLDAVRQPYLHPDHPQVGKPTSYKAGQSGEGYGDNGRGVGRIRTEHPAGAPPLDWWLINPTGYKGQHYASFAPELCVRPIEACCPRRVCRECGQPSRRITTTTQLDTGRTTNGAKNVGRKHESATDYATRTISESITTGWTSCGCPGADGLQLDGWHTGTTWRAGVVLDPFAGTGTVGAVATGHSRDAILIDLDPRNLELAQQRIGMFLVETTAAEVAAHVG